MIPKDLGPTILIEHPDGTIYNLAKMGYIVNSFTPPLSNWQHTWQQVGKYKADLANSEVQESTLAINLAFVGHDYYEFELMRLNINKIFNNSLGYFYVIWGMMPYLRYKCVIDGGSSIPQTQFLPVGDSFSLTLLCIDGFAESTATTQTPFTYDGESWGLGENLPNGVHIPYTFTTPSFKVYNASIIPLRAEEHPFTITFSGVVADTLCIKNVTTGQEFILNRSLSLSDTLTIVGLVPIVNESQDYGASNHAYLDLARGWNKFQITGATNFTISFNTHFYY